MAVGIACFRFESYLGLWFGVWNQELCKDYLRRSICVPNAIFEHNYVITALHPNEPMGNHHNREVLA